MECKGICPIFKSRLTLAEKLASRQAPELWTNNPQRLLLITGTEPRIEVVKASTVESTRRDKKSKTFKINWRQNLSKAWPREWMQKRRTQSKQLSRSKILRNVWPSSFLIKLPPVTWSVPYSKGSDHSRLKRTNKASIQLAIWISWTSSSAAISSHVSLKTRKSSLCLRCAITTRTDVWTQYTSFQCYKGLSVSSSEKPPV